MGVQSQKMTELTFLDKNCNLASLQKDIEAWFIERGFETQSTQRETMYFVQARKKGTIRALAGASRSLFVKIEGEPKNFKVATGTGKWVENLAATVITGFFTLGLTWVTGALLAGWQKKIESDLWDFIKSQAEFSDRARTQVPPPPPPPTEPLCPVCHSPSTYVKEYQRYYCYRCKQYIPQTPPPPPP
jgi:hypothetical protein